MVVEGGLASLPLPPLQSSPLQSLPPPLSSVRAISANPANSSSSSRLQKQDKIRPLLIVK
jgi:hypothetical protein